MEHAGQRRVASAGSAGGLSMPSRLQGREVVVDVPPKPAARVRLLDNDHSDKRRWCCTWSETDTHDARSTAIVALRNARLRQVTLEDHTAVLRLFARRHDGIRTRWRVGHHAHRVVRGRAGRRRLCPRLQRRHLPLPSAGHSPLQRDRPDRSLQRPSDPAPAQPRQPPTTRTIGSRHGPILAEDDRADRQLGAG